MLPKTCYLKEDWIPLQTSGNKIRTIFKTQKQKTQ